MQVTRSRGSNIVRRLADQIGLKLVRKLRSRTGPPTAQEINFTSSAGYRIAATLLKPAVNHPVPAIVLSPGGGRDRQFFFDLDVPLQAQELAEMGIAVLSHDPSGRGLSWGPEDWEGIEHQDNIVEAVRWLRQAAPFTIHQVGILGISLGSVSAVGAAKQLAQSGEPVSWLVDWNGPHDRKAMAESLTKHGIAPSRHQTDHAFWEPREAVKHVGDIQAGYWRVQTHPTSPQDAQPLHLEMINAAAQGQLPWFQLNEHAINQVPTSMVYPRTGQLKANRTLRRAISLAISRG